MDKTTQDLVDAAKGVLWTTENNSTQGQEHRAFEVLAAAVTAAEAEAAAADDADVALSGEVSFRG